MIEILYRDECLAVVVKPTGYISEDGEKSVPMLIREALNEPDAYVGTVHRLDKNVGGLMVYSLRSDVTGVLTEALSSFDCGKEYLACVRNVIPDNEGEMTDLLYHDKRTNKTFVVKKKRAGVREARLTYRVRRRDGDSSLVEVKLYTGRIY